jgi:hypothetical protein
MFQLGYMLIVCGLWLLTFGVDKIVLKEKYKYHDKPWFIYYCLITDAYLIFYWIFK